MLNSLEITGRARTHIVEAPDFGCLLHPAAIQALHEMRAAAARDGIDIGVASGFRDFTRQLSIWNAKFRGERTLLDRNSQMVDRDLLGATELVDTILLWTALPGASRHHWGTDFDIIDRASLPPGYAVRLTASEYAPGDIFGPLTIWLDSHMQEYGFFRPYRIDRGGVQPEAWHLSFAPIAARALEDLTVEVLREALEGAPIEGRGELIARLPELHARFVSGVDGP